MSAQSNDLAVAVARLRRSASSRFSRTVSSPNRRRFSSTTAMRWSHQFVRRHLADVDAVLHDAAGAGAQQAADGAHQRGLAGAVGADDRDRLAVADRKRDVVQHGERAIAGRQRVDLEHRQTPRYTSRTLAFCWIAAMLPLAMISPKLSTWTVSATAISSMSCETSRIGEAGLVDAPDRGDQLLHLLAVQPGGRLVEHQEPRLADQGARDLEDAPLAGGKRAGRQGAVEAELASARAPPALRIWRISPRACGSRSMSWTMPVRVSLQAPTMMFSSTRHALEDLRRLEGAHHSGAVAVLHRLRRQRLAAKRDRRRSAAGGSR